MKNYAGHAHLFVTSHMEHKTQGEQQIMLMTSHHAEAILLKAWGVGKFPQQSRTGMTEIMKSIQWNIAFFSYLLDLFG